MAEHGVSERMVCRVLGQHRSTECKIPTTLDDEAALTADIVTLAPQYGRYGYCQRRLNFDPSSACSPIVI